MKVQQISIFLENKAGRMAEVTRVLAEAGINLMALSMADTSDFGIMRMIVNDHEKARAALKNANFTVGINTVLVVEVSHKPGGLNHILQIFAKAGVNVEYMYAFAQSSANAIMVFRCDDEDKAIQTLQDNKINIIKAVEFGKVSC